jgi:transposase InsO family protein
MQGVLSARGCLFLEVQLPVALLARKRTQHRPPYLEPASPCEGPEHCESFNCKRRDELLKGEIFYTLAEAKIVIEIWRRHYNTKRPHSSLGYRPPAPEVIQWPATPSGAAPPATPAVASRPIMH